MKKVVLWLILCLFVGMGLHADDWSVEERLPENTFFVVTFPDLEQSQVALKETGVARLFRDPQMQVVFTELIAPYEEQITSLMRSYGEVISQANEIILGEVTIAVTGMSRGQIPVDAVVCVEIKSGMEMAQQGLSMLDGQIRLDENGYHVDGFAHFKFMGNRLVAATNMKLLQQIEVGDSANLKDNKSYQNAKSKVQKNHTPGVFTFVNLEQLYQTFSPMMRKRERALMVGLGVDKIKSLSMAVNIAGDHLHDALFVDYPGSTVIKDLVSLSSVSEDILRNVPQNASLVLGLNFNLKDFLNKFEKIIATVDPSGREVRGFRRAFYGKKNQFGVDIKNDIGMLFGEIGLFQYADNTTGLIPHTILAAKCSDPVTVGKLLGILARDGNVNSHRTHYRGHELYYFSVNAVRRWGYVRTDELVAMSFFFAGMGFYFDNGYVYAGEVQSLKDYIQQREQSQANITTNKNFKDAMGKLSVKNASFFVYRDVRSSFAAYWNFCLPMLRSLEGYVRAAGIPLDTALLPDGETLAGYFSPGGMGYAATDKGLMLESYSNVGGLKLAALPLFAVFLINEGLPYHQRRQIKRSIEELINALEDMMGDSSPFRGSRMQANESAAIAVLKSTFVSQGLFQSSCILDQNENGLGEYAFLQELTASAEGRCGRTEYAFLSRTLSPNSKGIATKNGYHFCIYLPGSEGYHNAISESFSITKTEDANTINQQEQRFICYAWPILYNKTGKRAFCVTEHGEVMVTNNASQRYSGNNKPGASASLNKKQQQDYDGTSANDGQVWNSNN